MSGGYGQQKLVLSQTSKVDVRNMDRENCPCPGHQKLMSEIWTVKTGYHPYFLSIFGISLSIFRTSNSDVWDMDKYFVLVPDIAVRIPHITVHIPDITVHIP